VLTASGGHPVGVLRLFLPFWLRWYAIPRYAIEVDTPAEAAAAAERVADLGADFLKIIVDRIPPEAPRISEESLRAAVHSASSRGLRTVAHIGTTADAIDAARAGVAAWVHGVYRERIPDERIAEMAAFGIPMAPTIVVFEALSRRGEAARQATRLERETVPAEVLAAFGDPPADSEQAKFFARSAQALAQQRSNWRDNVRRLHAAGVKILAGSDMQSGVFPGPGLHRELAHLHESGLSNLEAIRAATLEAARFLEERDDPSFGIVAVGKRADLLLVDGDPREDLAHLARIRAVVVRGILVERAPLAHSNGDRL
jgi:imidazolonepropionase-like amidohydrolase